MIKFFTCRGILCRESLPGCPKEAAPPFNLAINNIAIAFGYNDRTGIYPVPTRRSFAGLADRGSETSLSLLYLKYFILNIEH